MAQTSQITQLYKSLLGRAPDKGGLAHYSGYGSLDAVKKSILGSSEYKKVSASKGAGTAAKKPAAKPVAKPAPSQVDVLTKELGTFDKGTQAPIDIYNQTLDQLGISDVRTRVQGLREQLMNTESLLRGVEGSVTGRTQNSLVTEAQRQRLVASEQAPMSELLRTMGGNFENAQAEEQSILGEGKTTADLTFQGQQAQREALMGRLQIAIDSAKTKE
jgi:hypothetical protein